MPKKITTFDFIKKAKEVHNNMYDYSLVIYVKNSERVKIICKKHDIFEQRPDVHLRGRGCKKCGYNKLSKTFSSTSDDFIKKSESIHNKSYDYSLVEYKNNTTKVDIICEYHGKFSQEPRSHLGGSGCPYCENKYVTTEKFIEKSKLVHGDTYDYSKTIYNKSSNKVKIICNTHGEFIQLPNNHLSGKGCSVCRESSGERKVRLFLIKNDIEYESQKMFDGCSYKRKLKFDFYLPKYNMCIEYDGEQHFEKFRFEKNNDRLNDRIKKDNIKNTFCVENNIDLLRISYKENVVDILNKKFEYIHIIH